MANRMFKSRARLVAAAGLTLAFGAVPGTAQAGFFEQLFGAPQQQSSYGYEQPAQQPGFAEDPIIIRRPHVPRKIAEDKPALQKTTDLMHDKTLRPGDAVMMKSGIHVYTGRDYASHTSRDFAPLDAVKHIKANERVALAAMDVTRNDPLTKAMTPDTLASGRSAAVASPVVPGVKFTDNSGRTIRYVGP